MILSLTQWLSSAWTTEEDFLSDLQWNSLLSFLSGAASVALLWFWTNWQQINLASMGDALDDADNVSWVDPWKTNPHQQNPHNNEPASPPAYYWTDWTRIGELPAATRRRLSRSHWPWESIRRRVFAPGEEEHNDDNPNHNDETTLEHAIATRGENNNEVYVVEDANDDDDDELTLTDDEIGVDENHSKDSDHQQDNDEEEETFNAHAKKNICIGSIFGLDVGGTLAKLVYFEQKPLDYDPLVSPRERHYAVAASAQAVLMARRTGAEAPASSTRRLNLGGTNAVPRRRTLSLGCLGRFRQLQKQEEEEKEAEEKQRRQQGSTVKTTSMRRVPSFNDAQNIPNPNRMSSDLSELDLRHLAELRQESVPDDLKHYRTSVHFDTDENNTNEQQDSENPHHKDQDPQGDDKNNASMSSNMKKSRSMFDLSHSEKKAEALESFYNFARRLDLSYQDSLKDHKLSFFSRELGGEFHFLRFETRFMKNAMDLIRYNHLHSNICEMGATGGGAHKYAQQWEKMLGITMDKQDELDSLVAGMQFVLSTVVGECYTFRPQTSKSRKAKSYSETSGPSFSSVPSSVASESCSSDPDQIGAPLESGSSAGTSNGPSPAPLNAPLGGKGGDTSNEEEQEQQTKQNQGDDWWWSRKVQRDAISYSSSYPYLVVTIGTGVSVLRVDGPRQHERISGSTIGGGTYWGLIRLLTDVEDFDDVMRLAEQGDPSKVDMMVGDIYGNNNDALAKLGLPSHIVASSFGKLVAKQDPAAGLKQEDLARALLLMVTNNIGQVAYLNAKLHQTPRIYFVGNFLRRNMISQRRLSYAIRYWSKGEMEALFLEHEGYFGALGAFLMSQNISQKTDEGFFQWDEKKEGNGKEASMRERIQSSQSFTHHHRRTKTFGS